MATRDGYVVKVSDIGYAEDSYEEPRTTARLNGVAAVTLVVAKQSGENTVTTASEIKERLREIGAKLPHRCENASNRRPVGIYRSRRKFDQAPLGRRQCLRFYRHLLLSWRIGERR